MARGRDVRRCGVCGKSGHDRSMHQRNPEFRMTASGVRYPLRGTDGPGGKYDPAKTTDRPKKRVSHLAERRAARGERLEKRIGTPATAKAYRAADEDRAMKRWLRTYESGGIPGWAGAAFLFSRYRLGNWELLKMSRGARGPRVIGRFPKVRALIAAAREMPEPLLD